MDTQKNNNDKEMVDVKILTSKEETEKLVNELFSIADHLRITGERSMATTIGTAASKINNYINIIDKSDSDNKISEIINYLNSMAEFEKANILESILIEFSFLTKIRDVLRNVTFPANELLNLNMKTFKHECSSKQDFQIGFDIGSSDNTVKRQTVKMNIFDLNSSNKNDRRYDESELQEQMLRETTLKAVNEVTTHLVKNIITIDNEKSGGHGCSVISEIYPDGTCIKLDSNSLMDTNVLSFTVDLTKLINNHSLENLANIPDFILAEHLQNCLLNLSKTVNGINRWYDR
jgi:hypothetical protein